MKSKMRQKIESLSPELTEQRYRVFVESYPLYKNGLESGRRWRMKWADCDHEFTEEQKEKILALPGVIRVSHTKSYYYNKQINRYGCNWAGPVVSFHKQPSTIEV